MSMLSRTSFISEKNGASSVAYVGSKPQELPEVTLSPEQERKLWRKIDLRLLVIITLMYLFSFMDRGNIGNAELEGLLTQLNLTGNRFNVALTIYFIVRYFCLDLPLKDTRYSQLVAVRFCLGAAEAGFVPGATFYVTMWYPKYKVIYRLALFAGAAGAAGAFSGLLAYAIGFMNNAGDLQGWSWIFIIEGIATVVISVIGVLVLPDYPTTAKFLSTEEKQFVEQQRAIDIEGEAKGTIIEGVLSALTDWQVWTLSIISTSFFTGSYGITFFLP
ncbi:hypothetical protein ID866_9621 [Astraeus odoratus]|nr:hypothetical protein ID866_9621 [Astraeus odoratus]